MDVIGYKPIVIVIVGGNSTLKQCTEYTYEVKRIDKDFFEE